MNASGDRIAHAARAWSYRVEAPGLCQLDPDEAFAAVAAACREALASVAETDLRAIGVTSQRTGVVLVDEAGRELYAGPNADGRGAATGIALEREHAEVVYRLAGRLPVMLYLPARLGWFRQNAPEILARARRALSFSDWLVRRLTGKEVTEPTQAAEMLVFDLGAGAWSDELCERLGVPRAMLPDVLAPGMPAGNTLPGPAAVIGTGIGIPVVPAGCDTQCAALAMGVASPGAAAVVAGTTMICQQAVAAQVDDAERRLWVSPHHLGGFVAEAHCGEAGAPIDWALGLIREDHEWLDAAADSATPGGGGVAFVDARPSAVGDFALVRTGGLTFPVPLLALARSREDVARALVEGVAFAAVEGLGWLTEAAGAPSSVAVGGGVARLGSFVRVIATALGRPVRAATEPSASARGAAMLAAVGAGAHANVAAAVRAMADAGEEIAPVEGWAEGTAGALAVWRERTTHMEQTAMRVSHLTGLMNENRGA